MHAADLLSRRAELTPDRIALIDRETGGRYTYHELNRRACSLANYLRRDLGIQKGDRVSILAPNGLAYVDLLYGLPKIGAILTTLNWRLAARELAYIVRDCSPKVLIYDPAFRSLAEELLARVSVPHCLVLGDEERPLQSARDYRECLDAAPAAEPDRPPLDADDPYCIMYTSGTTGHPKGAVLPHRQILWNCINTVISWGLRETDISPILTPMFHAGGLFVFLTPLLYAGGRVVLTGKFNPEDSLRTIIEEYCTVILGVPTLFQMWMNSETFKTADFSHVRFFVSGGAPCPVSLIRAWQQSKGVVFRQGYGLTEVGTNCFSMTDEESVRKAGSVGKPIFHSRMRLVDPQGEDVPDGETGELLISGPHVCLGYWQNPEATAGSLVDGWFRTGDMARRDAEGFYYISGRFKDMLISGGENVYAAEVEAVFCEHAAVADAALIGQPDEKWGEVGLMIVVLHLDRTAAEAELLEFCRGRLARYKIPKRVIFSDGLPYSPYGKVMKAELKKQYLP